MAEAAVQTRGIVEGARLYAMQHFHKQKKPAGKTRSYESQIAHASAVAELVRRAGGGLEDIAASWLHDLVEDTDVTLADIDKEFGIVVYETVKGLTDDPMIEGLPVLERKKKQAEKLKDEPSWVRMIKLADQVANLRDVFHSPPENWDRRKCKDYATGAWMIAQICRGESARLDRFFDEAHSAVMSKYG